jgi:hypothetical protein
MTHQTRNPGAGGAGAVAEIGNRAHKLQFKYSPAQRQTLAATTRVFGTAYTRDHRRAIVKLTPVIAAIQRSPSADAYRGGPVTWTITLAGGETVVLGTAELLKYARFQRVCFQQLGIVVAPMRTNAWYALLHEAMRPLREGRR